MNLVPPRYFILNKPYDMVSQFISPHNVRLLGDLDYSFPEGIHAVGRLDAASEGLLILTTNKKVTRLLFQDESPHKRTYLVQVKNLVTTESLLQLQCGTSFRVKGGVNYVSTPVDVMIIPEPRNLFSSGRKLSNDLISTWLSITLTEGKYHQVRKMVAAVRHRCLRLIRISIEDLDLGNMQPGEVKEMGEKDFFNRL
ncbi:MAG: pseudouridine synthase, partial [Chitinophagaceae bacterium]